MKLNRRNFLKMCGVAVVAPTALVKGAAVTPVEFIASIQEYALRKSPNLRPLKINEWEHEAKPRNKKNPIFDGKLGVWDGVRIINT